MKDLKNEILKYIDYCTSAGFDYKNGLIFVSYKPTQAQEVKSQFLKSGSIKNQK